MEGIGLEATSATSGDVHGLSYPTVFVLLILVFILGIISSNKLRRQGLGVQNLFLKINMKRKDREISGFVRTLDVDEMNLVMTEEPQKGELLLVNLSSLPGFPAQDKYITGCVNRVKKLGGHNHNFLVNVEFKGAPEFSPVKDSNDLVEYLQHLHA